MNPNVIVSCAVTGAGDTVGKHDGVPVTPEQVADAAISAAQAGAAIAHIHVRDPETGHGSRDVGLFTEAVERVRASDTDVIINLTAGKLPVAQSLSATSLHAFWGVYSFLIRYSRTTDHTQRNT